ncbi:MAG: ABC transporter permease [Candidatus Dormibacteraeota bacterium]|nr:ABC transporter permease [Candidatus Dormibacteraeota bacterium]
MKREEIEASKVAEGRDRQKTAVEFGTVRRFFTASRLRAFGVEALGLTTFYVLVIIFFSVAAPHFLTYSNTLAILSTVTLIGIVSIGQALAIISGGFDLSVSGTVPLGAVLFAVLINHGVPVSLAIVLATLSGSTVGLVNGLIVTRLGINPLITTLGTLSVATGLAYTVTNGQTVALKDLNAGVLANIAFGGISYYVIALLLFAVLSFFLLRNTVFGRMLYAIGGNREASRLAGLRIDLITATVYVLSGSLAAFAGVIIASELLAGTPTVGSDAALSSIAAVILGGAALTGGVGGIPGTLVGVLVLGTIANGMALLAVPSFYQQIATGAVLLLAVGFGRLRTLL